METTAVLADFVSAFFDDPAVIFSLVGVGILCAIIGVIWGCVQQGYEMPKIIGSVVAVILAILVLAGVFGFLAWIGGGISDGGSFFVYFLVGVVIIALIRAIMTGSDSL